MRYGDPCKNQWNNLPHKKVTKRVYPLNPKVNKINQNRIEVLYRLNFKFTATSCIIY